MFWWEQCRGSYGLLNAYALEYNLDPHTPFLLELLRVIDESFTDFYEHYVQNTHLHSDWHYVTHICECFPKGRAVIERVLRDDSNDKSTLFLSFDASTPTEGSNIFFNTPPYRRGIFWSNFKKEVTSDHNRIRSCFCQSQVLLDLGLSNFFDYIIIGGQTIEYLNLETWGKLCHFLKEGGCIVYPEMVWFYWGGEIINHLFNLLSDGTCEFELQRCANPDSSAFSEIKVFTKLNSIPSYGDFCYNNPDLTYVFYFHKKL